MIEVAATQHDDQPTSRELIARVRFSLADERQTRLLNEILGQPSVTARQPRRVTMQIRDRHAEQIERAPINRYDRTATIKTHTSSSPPDPFTCRATATNTQTKDRQPRTLPPPTVMPVVTASVPRRIVELAGPRARWRSGSVPPRACRTTRPPSSRHARQVSSIAQPSPYEMPPTAHRLPPS